MDIDLSFIQNIYFKSSLNEYLESLFLGNKKVLGIILFGSLATQKAKISSEKVSDIDLLVVFENKELPSNHMERTQLKIDLMGFSLSGIDSIWMNKSEFEGSIAYKSDLILSIFDEGIILYDPKKYLYDSKIKLLRELDEKGVKKKNGYWIWPKKRLDEVIEW
jgi:predicted nucleotidyltransferase